ncbi:uncharacterized protein J4E79_001063 [Alternaria viburni]|uniref:uncharacterized protein n=1 Tax=Alternaria viburni TaxID=566460 RepID=UPI0020C33D78|nr:uncharacterized protein J4E79_001063 [Alternaria viburni]KAI4669021.1 hypothetical protein J4E79_001063 [Alternaria viburni]
MPRKSPPYKSGLPYFKRDCEAYFPTNASTVTWSRAEQNNTVNTLWYGSRIIRDYYNARIGRRELFGLPTPNPIPDNPFNASDVTFARTNKSMPTYRDGLGGTEPAWVNAPAGFGALAMTVPPPAVVVAGPVAAPVRAVTVSQPRPVNRYPFNFWPPKPWDAEPDDATLGMTIKAIKSKEEPENGLWCAVDDNNIVTARIVVKEVRPHNWKWRDPAYWRDYLPREIRIHERIDANRPAAGADTSGYDNLLRHLGYRLMMQQRRFKLYLDFCEGGDLFQGLKEHFDRWKRGQATDKIERLKVVPESLVWHVLSQLVDACLVLQTGSKDPATAESAWPPITHLDISLSNIFLEPAADDAYPNCVLSDFGMAMYDLEQSDPAVRPSDNPQEYVLGHTSCKYPPEQQLARGTPPDLTPLNEKSDVWSIGAAVWYMIANRSVAGPQRELHYSEDMPQNVNIGEADHGRLDEPGAKPFEGLGFPALSKYSEELRSLVARCMNWEQEHRPDLATLRAKINAYLASHPKVKDSRDFGPLRMSNLEQGLEIGDTFVRKRRKPVAGKQARKRRKEDEDNSEE